MNRPLKEPSKTNIESAGLQHQRELDAQRRRQDTFAAQEADRIKAMYGTREEKQNIARQLASDLDKLIAEKQEIERERLAEDRRHDLEMITQMKYQEILEKEEAEARQAYAEYLAAQQRAAIAQHQEERRREQAEERAERPQDFFGQHFARSTR